MKQTITQKELADKLGIPANSLCKFLGGKRLGEDNIYRAWKRSKIPLHVWYYGSRSARKAALEKWCGKRINFGKGRI